MDDFLDNDIYAQIAPSIPMDTEILKRIYKYCAYQDRSTSEVRKKLTEWEVDSEEQELIIIHLEAERFLDEARFAHSFARGKFNVKKWGRNKIRHELKLRQVPAQIIEKAIREEITDEDYLEAAQKLTHQKRKQFGKESELKQKEKIFRFLVQKGYEWDVIREAWEGN